MNWEHKKILLDYQMREDSDDEESEAIGPRIFIAYGALRKHAYNGEFVISNDNIPGAFGSIDRFELEHRHGWGLKIMAYNKEEECRLYDVSINESWVMVNGQTVYEVSLLALIFSACSHFLFL
jgi:hypothetical protein